jgi:hypothetical protein
MRSLAFWGSGNEGRLLMGTGYDARALLCTLSVRLAASMLLLPP